MPSLRTFAHAFAGVDLRTIPPADRQRLALLAEVEHETRERFRAQQTLQDFIPSVTPRWSSPRHLARLTDLFERIARGERVRALVSVPPQHGKTETILHGLAWLLRKRPHLRNVYASYAASIAFTKSRLARDYATAAGVQLRDDANKVNEWVTTAGGGLLATGVGGPLTGNPVDGVLLADDPHKNRAEAESATLREHLKGWWTSTAMTRVHPQASIVVVHTRWHPDDLIGWLHDERPDGWEVIALRAIADGTDPDDPRQPGEALWPQYMPADFLAERRRDVGEYDWASLYDQRPRPKGGAVFGGTHLTTTLPTRYRVAIGLDLAYTDKTSSDYSVAVVLAEQDGAYTVIEVVRVQLPAPAFAERVRALKARYPAAPLVAYVGGTERGVVDLLNRPDGDRPGLGITAKPAVADKFLRAQPVAAAWNRGAVLLPATAQDWTGPFVSELRSFTGVKDRHDDQCLIAGTLIETARGSVPIEEVTTSDLALTPRGFRRVTAAGRTSDRASVLDVTLTDGRVLTATAGHPVFVVAKGFRPVDSLASDDEVVVCPTASSSTASASIAIPSPPSSRISGITAQESATRSAGFKPSIRRSGRPTTAPSPMGSRSIIAMATGTTTPSRTSSASAPQSTAPSTPTITALPSRSSTSPASVICPLPGTHRPKVAPGTRSMEPLPGRVVSGCLVPAPSAARPFRPTSLSGLASARPSARTLYGDCVIADGTPSRAHSAANHSSPPSARSVPAPVRVQTVYARLKPEPVYNLTVEGEHAYFANGVLVHNCDALAAAFDALAKPPRDTNILRVTSTR